MIKRFLKKDIQVFFLRNMRLKMPKSCETFKKHCQADITSITEKVTSFNTVVF